MTKSLLFLFLLSLPILAFSQDKYQSQWNKVEKLELKNLPQSALAVTDSIYQQAKAEGNSPQWIKAMLYQAKFALTLEEEAQVKIIAHYNKEIAQTNAPERNILESMLAQFYWQYFKDNRYRFYDRSQTSEVMDSTDFRTWNLDQLYRHIYALHVRALQDQKKTQQTPIDQYQTILLEEDRTKGLTPSLFDVLAHRALDFYKNDESSIHQPKDKFLINEAGYFQDENYLPKYTSPSLSTHYEALRVYHQLIDYHRGRKNENALVANQLERLRFVAENYTGESKEKHYEDALSKLYSKYQSNSISTLITYDLATLYHNMANQYSPEDAPLHQFKRREALQVLEKAIATFPDGMGTESCSSLRKSIIQPYLELTTEKYLPINQKARILAEYKNLDELEFTVYDLDVDQYEQFERLRYKNAQSNFIQKLKPFKSWKSKLKNEEDYQLHSMDNLLPALPAGTYLIVANSESKDLETFGHQAYQVIQVTDMALIHQNIGNKVTLQVIDRLNGAAIEGAKITMSSSRYDKNTRLPKNALITNDRGFVEFKVQDQYYGVKAKVEKDGQMATFGNFNSRGYYSYHEGATIKTHLFTDRSIYRPGQTVFFKGILVKRANDQSEIVPKASVEVVLKDVNGEKVSELLLESNEYGSFSGEFVLPTTGLTGNFQLEVNKNDKVKNIPLRGADFTNGHQRISVEEYKRPTFEASFKPIDQEYQVNDSIQVHGEALAYSGSKISNATMTYRVVREVQMPYWYYWRRPVHRAPSQEIAHGTLQTDAEGQFTLPFKAIPDESVPEGDQPLFRYTVSAEFTDINGETRTANTTVKIGYHALLLNLDLPEQGYRQQDSISLSINSTNLNDINIPASGKLKIYKLTAPGRILRDSPLSSTDYQRWDKDEFIKHFPHEPFRNEGDPLNWEKGKLIVNSTFDTEKEKEINLTGFDQWSTGKYLVELESMDKFGQKVSVKALFTLLDKASKTVPDHQLLDIQLDQSSYSPEDTATLTMGTAADNLTVSVFLEKDGVIKNTWLVNLKKGYKSLSFPVESTDLGGFVIHYTTAFASSSIAGQLPVNVPYPKKELQIETLTFRDKIQPGSDQKWTLKVKGPQKDSVAAELLASMYDASLDQFKPHQWGFSTTTNHYRSQASFNSHSSFSTTVFERKYYMNIRFSSRYDALPLTQFNWFGFHFSNPYYPNYRYVQSLREKWIPIDPKITYDHDESLAEGLVKGTITDVDEKPLVGVNVSIAGKEKGVLSDLNGEFSIEAASGDELEFSFIGFLSTTASISPKRNVIHVVLPEDISGLEEVVVVGYQANRKESNAALLPPSHGEALDSRADANQPPAEIAIRGKASGISAQVLYIIDGKISTAVPNQSDIATLEELSPEEAVAIYGDKATNGAIIITTKEGQALLDQQMAQVQARTDLRGTAFFYPHLSTDSIGNISFSFTAPESLTKWKLQLLAHTQTLDIGYKQLQAITQKDLMVTPNAPRFLREGDELVLSAKISNLSDAPLSGRVRLALTDPITGKVIDQQLDNNQANEPLQIGAKGNTVVNWFLKIPEGLQAVQYKVMAVAGNFSDGEQNVLPILSNRMLVTESMPMWINTKGKKSFEMENMIDNPSTTLTHHRLTLEVTSNPAWYAVQALPYLMEYPYECAEQTYSRFFANALAKHIVDSHPRLKTVFESWKNQDSGALLSNLEKNQELKSLIIQETPWLQDAQSESEQKRRIALLFDLNKITNELSNNINKLSSLQMSSGGFPWFKGSRYPHRYITQYIVVGLAELQKMNVQAAQSKKVSSMIDKAMKYLDQQLLEDYQKLQNKAEDIKNKTDNADKATAKINGLFQGNVIRPIQVHYLYLRSLRPESDSSNSVKEAFHYYQQLALRQWTSLGLQEQAMVALMSYRTLSNDIDQEILKSLLENSVHNPALGRYWKANRPSWHWNQAPIETQALLIKTFTEIPMDDHSTAEQANRINEMKIWLLKHKQTNQWSNTKATASAVQALLLQGTDWLSIAETVQVTVGHQKVTPAADETIQQEAGTGYFKKSWSADQITPEMGKVTLTNEKEGIVWGALYWQYFEDLDNIQHHTATPLKITKKLFVKAHTDQGEIFHAIEGKIGIKVGDLVKVRIEIKVDRDMEFVHLKDMRAAGFEPVNVLSSYQYQDGLGYYESTRDASTNFFFERLNKGVYVFEYQLRANNAGIFSNGISTIQCMYAPEFSSHSDGLVVRIDK
ncbi:alpha-2-macroglobulin family protein [Echinicola rosea]|uniref:Alpha-2-macroglobulin n=1 Tax=Echinicola rosea TaxID=1807691 RepID=A0ABQ1VA79_9BACT|nr:MG2 domain-containing protein [Echinicola rosea]GGF48366.1 hypothetical protein GCM10011339_41220 [Echinicola rosea]